jgi:hypothetical protein
MKTTPIGYTRTVWPGDTTGLVVPRVRRNDTEPLRNFSQKSTARTVASTSATSDVPESAGRTPIWGEHSYSDHMSESELLP